MSYNQFPEFTPAAPAVEGTGRPQSGGHLVRTKRVVAIVAAGALIAAAATQGRGHKVSADINPAALAQSTSWNSTSDNWSGYAETSAQTGRQYTEAAAEWTVPSVTKLTSSNRVGCAALWTGIGGETSKDLIQLGTDSCANATQTGYFAWYEILPAAGTPIQAVQVQPGDRVIAELHLVSGSTSASAEQSNSAYQEVTSLLKKYDPAFGSTDVVQRLRQLLAQGEAVLEHESWWPKVSAELHKLFSTPAPSGTQTWELSFKITSPSGAVQTWSKTLNYASSLSSSEFITEAPTAAQGVQPLPNYGVAHFLGVAANSSTPSFSASNQIVLGDPNGQASVPSAPVGQADAFNTCYFPTYHISACPNPS